GNMKLMLNGAVTLGTEDGANVEIHEAVGDDNIIIFGMSTEEVKRLSREGYQPMNYYYNNEKLKAAIDYLNTSIAGMSFPGISQALTGNDRYMVMADFADYCAAQEKASALYRQKDIWNDMALVNIAKAGRFAADRSISDYANNIWNAKKI
ncbi:MAG: glycogen/starch/alpha-glucan phosphorylase, partial [Clostridia bacterium]|nr:glycogen/starch/alpha-glucan phosphorylase [Clostridia bacterium]